MAIAPAASCSSGIAPALAAPCWKTCSRVGIAGIIGIAARATKRAILRPRRENPIRTISATAAAGSEPLLCESTVSSSSIVVAPTISARSGHGRRPRTASASSGQAQISQKAALALR